MDLNFTRVNYEDDLTEFSEEDLRELVSEYEDAQKANVAEFEAAAEALDDVDEETISDFEDARASLIEEITGAEAFDEVPLTESALGDASFGELREWRDFVAENGDEEDETDGEDNEDGVFENQGKKAPINEGGDDDTPEFVEDALDDIQGLNL